MKKLFWAVVVIVIIGLLVLGGKSKDTDQAMQEGGTGPITIGFVGPLTGDAAAYGEPSKNGVEIAVKEINAAGGINGRQVNVVYEDGKCDGQGAASAAQKLVNSDKVKMIVASECSGGVFGLAPVIKQANVAVIATLATNPKVAGLSEYIVRNAPNDAKRGVMLADYAKKSGYKKVAVIAEQTDYAQGIKSTFVDQAKKDGLEIVASEDFVTNTADFRSILTKIKQTNPDVLLIDPQTGAAAVRVAEQARQIGIKAPFIGSEFNGPEVSGAGAATEGFVVAVAPGLAAGKEGDAFLAAYKAAYGVEPSYAYYAGASYDATKLFAQAIASVGEDATKVKDYLHNLGSYTGTIGNYSFGADGDVVGIEFVFQKLVKGKFVDHK